MDGKGRRGDGSILLQTLLYRRKPPRKILLLLLQTQPVCMLLEIVCVIGKISDVFVSKSVLFQNTDFKLLVGEVRRGEVARADPSKPIDGCVKTRLYRPLRDL